MAELTKHGDRFHEDFEIWKRAETALVATAETRANASYGDLATAGPAVTVEVGRSGRVLVATYARLRIGTAYMSSEATGTNTQAALDSYAIQTDVGNFFVRWGATFLLTGFNAGATIFTAKYKGNGADASEFSDRRITVIPL